MTVYEQLLQEAYDAGVIVRIFPLKAHEGLYFDRHIYISDQLSTNAERACILAEELGHYYTVVGNILNQDVASCRRLELDGRRFAYKRLVSIHSLVEAYLAHVQGLYELSEYLEVTLEFLQEALAYYRHAYGTCATHDQYIVTFDPLNVYPQNSLRILA